MHTYITTNNYVRKIFGQKVYKLSLSAAKTCPNRDGKAGVGGCIFCSSGGSGDFAASSCLSIKDQIAQAKAILGDKGKGLVYIAYFQSFTGTYGDLKYLEGCYQEAINQPDVVGLSIATRPDCLDEAVMSMLSRLAAQKPLWVELGLQTMHEATARKINRGYELSVYEEAMSKLKKLGVHRITHIILGLPGESKADMLATVKYVGQRTDGIKLQLLHVLEHTKLAEMYRSREFAVLEPKEYYNLVADAVLLLPEDCVIHRLTGDGPKKDLIAPKWSGNKKRVMADMQKLFKEHNIIQAQI